MAQDLKNKRILLIVSGGVAAYKTPELIRLIKKAGGQMRCILTKGGAQFLTPLTLAAISGEPVYEDLWSLKEENEMGHIQLSREADLIVIAPASANMIAKMAHGLADDLASTTLLAANKPVLIAPAINHKMWEHPATQANIAILKSRGVRQVGPTHGEMACNETGLGRMAEPEDIFEAILAFFSGSKKNAELSGLKAIITSGPTFEPIDPVRFIGNRSSGKQGAAIADALAAEGAAVSFITGPGALPSNPLIEIIAIQTAAEMLKAVEKALPAEIFVSAAAVADWSPVNFAKGKIKKQAGKKPPAIELKENPDILKTVSAHKLRPKLVIGFAAETGDLLKNAQDKLKRKGCDWILANDARHIGADSNHVYFVTAEKTEDWKRQSKESVAEKLAEKIAARFQQ